MTSANSTSPLVRGFKIFLILLGVGLLVFNQIRIIGKPIGDFHNHWNLGYNLLHGRSLYLGRGFETPAERNPYPPFWAMAHAPLTIVSAHTAQIVLFLPLYLGALFTLLWTLHRLIDPPFPLSRDARWWATALAMLIALQFLSRDLSECGANIWLVAFSWLAIYAWTCGKDWLGGASLGLAIALKMTAGLFVPYFLWKRQWRIAAAAAMFAAVFSVSPILVRGPTRFAQDVREWLDVVSQGRTGNPLVGVLGDEPTSNFSMRPAIGRLVMPSPPDEDIPVAVNLLSLEPKTASMLVTAIELFLVLSFAWIVRGRADDRGNVSLLYEFAGVSLLILLLSPITWGHHCVGTLPALLLIFTTAIYLRRLPTWMLPLLAYVVLSLALNRAFVGKRISLIMSSLSVVTWEIACLLILTLGYRSLMRRAKNDRALPHGGPERSGTPRSAGPHASAVESM